MHEWTGERGPALTGPRPGLPRQRTRADGAALLRALGLDALVQIVDRSALAVCLVDDDGWAYLNDAALQLAGAPLADLLGEPPELLLADRGLELLPTQAGVEAGGRSLQVALLRHRTGPSRQEVAEAAAQLERQRLARDLHDSVTAALFGVHQRAQVVQRALDKGDEALLRVAAQDLQALSEQALSEVRALLRHRRAPGAADLAARLEDLVQGVRVRDGLEVELALPHGSPAGVPEDVVEHVHRIAGEALHNAVKHAAAGSARLRLELAGSELVLTVTDDGRGFEPAAAAGGHGQRTMRERAALCGGWLTVDSAPGSGTRVVARVPLPG